MKKRFACLLGYMWFLPVLLLAQRIEMEINVLDESEKPVTNATAVVSSFVRWEPGEAAGRSIFDTFKKQADTNGVSRFTFDNKRGDIKYSAYAPNFYGDWTQKFVYEKINGKWQPENKKFSVLLKRVLYPVPMYAKRVQSSCEWRDSEKRLAYDLVKGGWVMPYGKGETADFIFCGAYTVTGRSRYGTDYYEMTCEMTFSNADDGMVCVRIPPKQGSVLRLPYFAPDSGYEPVLRQEKRVRPYDRLHLSGPELMRAEKENNKQALDEDLNYFFRVRTKKNSKGEIVSALYGKIYGPVEFKVSTNGMDAQFTYYLNPTPNDRNTECDLSKNLLGDLPLGERPQYP